jgi:hypothetical protein
MTSRVLVSLFAVALLPGASPAGDRSASAIQGVWKTVEVTVAGPAVQTFRNVQPNLTLLTGSHYARVEVHADSPRPVIADAAKATADELRATWGSFFAEAGMYELTGPNEMTMRPIVAKNPAAMAAGVYTVFSYKLEGNTIQVTTVRDQNGPIPVPVTIKAVRVE